MQWEDLHEMLPTEANNNLGRREREGWKEHFEREYDRPKFNSALVEQGARPACTKWGLHMWERPCVQIHLDWSLKVLQQQRPPAQTAKLYQTLTMCCTWFNMLGIKGRKTRQATMKSMSKISKNALMLGVKCLLKSIIEQKCKRNVWFQLPKCDNLLLFSFLNWI